MSKESKIEKVSELPSSIIEHRERLSAAKPLAKPADIPYRDILIPLKQNVHIPIRIYRPKNSEPLLPTIFYVPGTAFIATEVLFTQVICTHLAERSGCQVIVINHRLAPENQFPTGLNDAYNLLKFFLGSPDTLFRINKDKTAIVGYSSGGNFAASMAIRGKEEGLRIARQILISPVLDLSRSLKDFKKDFEDKDSVISDSFVEWFLNLYLPDGMDTRNPWLSPFWQKSSQLSGLPPTDIIFAEFDRFRSDAQAYYTKLKRVGVDVHDLMVPGDHSFLWYKLEIVEAIGERIKLAFTSPSPENALSLKQEHQLIFIKPHLSPQKNAVDDEKENPTIRAKL